MERRSHDIARATTGTYDWLLRDDRYERWAASHRGLLWVKGKPGSGKSTLLKYALDNHETRHGDDDMILSFFFHGGGDELQRTPLGFFRSLLYQVLGLAPGSLPDLVDSFGKKRNEIGEPGEKWQWNQKEFQRFLESSLPKVTESRSVWLFVDALDECGEEDAVYLAEGFRSLLDNLPSTASNRLHICFSCRHYPILDLETTSEICLDDENRDDISTYVQAQLSALCRTAPSIPATIIARASGLFLWASLMVKLVQDRRRRGARFKAIEAEIHSISQGLDDLYSNLVQSMDDRPASLKLIQWICFATRPLSLDELRWAIIVDPDCPYQSLQECRSAENFACDCDNICSCDVMERRVKTLTCGLAEIIPSSPTHVVHFIHQSVKDFFFEKGLSALDSHSTSTLTDTAIGIIHNGLARTCIRYLAMEEIGRSTNDELEPESYNFPLLHYATTSWVAHAKQCDARNVSQDNILELFSWPSNDLVELFVRVYQVMVPYSIDNPGRGSSLAHVMSRYGVLGLLTAILQRADQVTRCIDIDSKDISGRTPLSWAAESGHEAIVKLLLATGKVEVDLKDTWGRTPLLWAAESGHEAIVKLLLATGKVEIDSKDDDSQTPLWWAARRGHEAIVKLLLATGKVKVDLKDDDSQTPLLCAAKSGHEAIVKLLLATGKVKVDLKNDKYSRTPLWWAARSGHEAIVKLLLATGKVEVDLKDDKYGRTPLSWAARSGHEAIVKLLLATGKVKVDSKDDDGKTPLSWAAESGHEAIVKLLELAK